MTKKKGPAAVGPAQKNAVLTLETHFTFKNRFMRKRKSACGIRPSSNEKYFDIFSEMRKNNFLKFYFEILKSKNIQIDTRMTPH